MSKYFLLAGISILYGWSLGASSGYDKGYTLGQKEVAAYKTELELSKKETDRAVEMYTELLATCRGEQ